MREIIVLLILSLVSDKFNFVHSQLMVKRIQPYLSYNTKNHHTDLFDSVKERGDLIVRRASPVIIGIEFTEDYNLQTHAISLILTFGDQPNAEDGSLVILPIKDQPSKEKNGWEVAVFNRNSKLLDLKLGIPVTAPVGLWRIRLRIQQEGGRARTFQFKLNFYVLFNAWAKDDQVFIDGEEKRKEYVLNDIGKIYMGTYESQEAREWFYGQFKSTVLPAVMFILDKSFLDVKGRSDVVQVSAALSALVNANDDNGVIMGKWEEPYSPHKAPWDWMGSAVILQQYHKSNGEPVKYGQCWVFAAVTTTIGRALGIPIRTVTNYRSAHDTQKFDLVIKRFFDVQGESVSNMSRDSIWNFHVWNDVFIRRDDLKNPKYNGWNAIDATPQEMSNGIFQMGPAPLLAVKEGDINIPYNAPFVYAEVNADLKDSVQDRLTGRFVAQPTILDSIGPLLITKRPGPLNNLFDPSIDEEITLLYKYPEGSIEERQTFKRASAHLNITVEEESFTSRSRDLSEQVLIKTLTRGDAPIGKPFTVAVLVASRINQKRTVDLNITVSSAYYTGKLASTIKVEHRKVVVEPKKNLTIEFTVTPNEYLKPLVEFSIVKIHVTGKIEETKQTVSDLHSFKLENPSLKVETNVKTAKVDQEYELKVIIENPLAIKLKNCRLTIEGRFYGPKEIKLNDIDANGKYVHIEKIKPTRAGQESILVNFSSDDLKNVIGKINVDIQ